MTAAPPNVKAVVLVGGPSRGTRFRPLSMNHPKPLFPVAGYPIVYHHITALAAVPGMKEILLVGFFEPQQFQTFLSDCASEFSGLTIRYLREYQSLGTGGGLFHFRDQIMRGNPAHILVLHADVCSGIPLTDMLEFHIKKGGTCTILATQVPKEAASRYGCIVMDPLTSQVLHYVEKPETFVSDTISCGIYAFTPEIFVDMEAAVKNHQQKHFTEMEEDSVFAQNPDLVRLEQDILRPLAGSGRMFLFKSAQHWRQIKTAGSALPANKLYLNMYRQHRPERLAPANSNANGPTIIGDVFIHPTANVHNTAKLGPNVSIGARVSIGKGVRVKESIILDNVEVKPFACIAYSIVGWNSKVGVWARLEGSPSQSSGENVAAAKLEGSKSTGEQSDPSAIDVNILGEDVFVCEGAVIRNCIVLPHKELKHGFKNRVLM